MSGAIDVIVRFHDMDRLLELERCVFSLTTQTYRPLHVILCTQRFTQDQLEKLRACLDPLFADMSGATLRIENYDKPSPKDARTALLQLGIDAASGTYLAFLDYDDVLYAEAYEMLIQQLRATGAGIAFASVRVASVDVYDTTLFTKEMDVQQFQGKTLLDLLTNNFCPLHSYVIDRSALPDGMPKLDPDVVWEEDYAMLLQIVSQVTADFGLLQKQIGLYAYKTDGSNSVATAETPTAEAHAKYQEVIAAMENLKDSLVVSEQVQNHLRLKDPGQERTVTEVAKLLRRKAFLSPLTT